MMFGRRCAYLCRCRRSRELDEVDECVTLRSSAPTASDAGRLSSIVSLSIVRLVPSL